MSTGQDFNGLGEFAGSLQAIREVLSDFTALAERLVDAEGALANAHRTIQAQKEEMAAMLEVIDFQRVKLLALLKEKEGS